MPGAMLEGDGTGAGTVVIPHLLAFAALHVPGSSQSPPARGDGNPPCRMNRAGAPVRRSSAIPPSGRRGRRPYAHDQARWSGSSRNPGCAARALPLAACRRRRDGLPSSEAKRRSLHPALRDARAPGSIALPSGEAIVIAAVQGMPQFGNAPFTPRKRGEARAVSGAGAQRRGSRHDEARDKD